MKIWIAILSILGGLAGLTSGFLVTAGGAAFGDNAMASDGAAVFWLSVLAIFLGFLSWLPKLKKLSGFALIAISLYGFVVNGLFFTVAFIFLVIAGCMAAFSKNKKKQDLAA
jgi:hypothetical protein